jgi:hypothetical protein
MNQLSLHFDGSTYNHSRDSARLTGQWFRVFNLMQDGVWRTLREISNQTGDSESSVSARLRDFRKPRFGGHTVNREYIQNGLYRYKLTVKDHDTTFI